MIRLKALPEIYNKKIISVTADAWALLKRINFKQGNKVYLSKHWNKCYVF